MMYMVICEVNDSMFRVLIDTSNYYIFLLFNQNFDRCRLIQLGYVHKNSLEENWFQIFQLYLV